MMIVQFVNYFMEDILLIDFYTKPYITSLSNYFSSPYIDLFCMK